MRALVLLSALALAATAFATTADRDPTCVDPKGPEEPLFNPAWGQLIRSWATTGTNQQNLAACTRDGYFISGKWTSFSGFYVYRTTGTFVRSVTASGVSGTRDGTGKCHLGSGYFASIDYGSGMAFWPYTAGGTPGSSPSTRWSQYNGRGVSWDGGYYYITNGSWSDPIVKVNTSGSIVGTITGSPWGISPYGHATPAQSGGNVPYLYVTNQSNSRVEERSLSTGALTRSFSVSATTGGMDVGYGDGYIYYVQQTTMNTVYVYDGDLLTTVAPTSLGKIKTLYR